MVELVADGRRRLTASDEYWAEYWRTRAALEKRYERQLQRAPLFERIRLKARMRSELKSRMEEISPSGALYVES